MYGASGSVSFWLIIGLLIIGLFSIAELDVVDDQLQQVEALDSFPPTLGRLHQLEHHRQRSISRSATSGLLGPKPHCGEG